MVIKYLWLLLVLMITISMIYLYGVDVYLHNGPMNCSSMHIDVTAFSVLNRYDDFLDPILRQ